MQLTQALKAVESGDREARMELLRTAYNDLRNLAAAKMRKENINHTLTATALVHEISMKMMEETHLPTGGRGKFLAYASTAMRNHLIDHARTNGRQKRGGGRQKFSLDEALIACEEQRDQFLALNDAVDRLGHLEPRKAKVVEMRYFGGMSNQEVANALDVSLATVKRDWDVAKTWLLRELSAQSSRESSAEE